MRRRRLFVAALAVVTALLAAACRDPKPPAAAPRVTEPPTTLPAPVSTIPAATTTSTTVPTSTTTTRTTVAAAVTIGPGEAFIAGSVQGPAGPIDGATVKVERLVGASVATAEVTTSGGGAWRMDSVLGGAYRVRAFKAPDLTQSNVEVFFLAATERKTVELRLERTDGERISAVISPNPPRVSQPATLTIQIGLSRVDDVGRPAVIPRIGAVLQLSVGAGQALESSPQAVTDATGSATWRLRCLIEGPIAVTLTVGTGSTPVPLPACVARGAAPAVTTTIRPR